jgi:site-specific DNA-methyltransferase (adenine-specific)
MDTMGENNMYEIYNQDCLVAMKQIKNKSIDLILADLPYGTTKLKWDIVIPFDKLWKEYNRIIKPNGAIILFGKQPFTSFLIQSNLKDFRYEIIWNKKRGTDIGNTNKKPLNAHENLAVFYKKQPTYNKMDDLGFEPYVDKRNKTLQHHNATHTIRQGFSNIPIVNNGTRVPTTIRTYFPDNKKGKGSSLHPTQKPVDLLEWIIKSYTNENEIVLDNTMGSGSTGIACLNTNRYFIGMELDKDIFEVAKNRIDNHLEKMKNGTV